MIGSRTRCRLLLAAALATSCATTPPPPPRAPRATPSPPPPRAPPSPSPRAPEPPPPPAAGPAVVPPAALRLAWVNPARCLSSCTFDPSPELVRVNDVGEPDARGRHRVARSVQPALRDLIEAAAAAGHRVKVSSAFRSYRDQARMFASTKEVGRAARPGHSEHQLGSAIDLRLPTSAAVAWLAEAAPGFGFALSYPDGHQRVTGYRPEPWHVRFVGRELAETIHHSGASVEETLRARPELGESGSCEDCPLAASRARCGAVTATGECRGSVLTWCYDGALATVDCAVSGQRCGPSPGSAGGAGAAGEPDCR
jgi:D-alanyl-D-alanine carboxypeptidase